MRINIKAKPNSKEEKVEKTDDGSYSVSVKEPPIQGRANRAIIKILGEYFNKPDYKIKIVSGWTARTKVVDVAD